MSEPDGRPIETDELIEEAAVEEAAAAAVELDIAQLVAEKDEYRELAQRVQADFENYRKRMLREQTETMERATESIIVQLLPVLDNFELALPSFDDADENVRKGVEILYAELVGVLAKAGLEPIDAMGEPFDPNEHEAVAQEDGDGEPVVCDVLRSGYRLKGRVIRPATVRVTRAGTEADPMAPQREWFEKDYYAVLGLQAGANEKDVQSAYRKLAKQYHPDANPGDGAAEERFKEVSAAHDVLGDPARRKEYDEVRQMVASGVGPDGHGGYGPGFEGAPFNFEGGDLGDLLGNIFRGGGGGRRGRGRQQSAPQRGADLETELQLDFLDAVHGATTSVSLTSDAACSECGGTGAERGTLPTVCPNCHGSGAIAVDQGPFSFSEVCPTCGGRGQVIEHRCKRCKGSGVERRRRDVKVRIPPGVRDGQRIRVKGRGAAGRHGGPPGDLYVVVRVQPHPVFGRSGAANLTIKVPITFAEAALGAQVKVPTLDDPITVKVPPGTQSGKTVKVRGRGVPCAKGEPGDLLVTFDVVVPEKLSDEQRVAVESLGTTLPDNLREHLGV